MGVGRDIGTASDNTRIYGVVVGVYGGTFRTNVAGGGCGDEGAAGGAGWVLESA